MFTRSFRVSLLGAERPFARGGVPAGQCAKEETPLGTPTIIAEIYLIVNIVGEI